jgi:DDE superfamily endonuclease
LLVHAAQSFFAVPLAARIHEGLIWSNRDQRTLLDKMLALLGILTIGTPFYFVADAYYAAGKVVKGLLEQGHHLVTRVRSNAVAYLPVEPTKAKRKRGAPRRYGKKINLKSLFADPRSSSPVPFTASATSFFAITFVICCGVLRDGWSASWPSFTRHGELAY